MNNEKAVSVSILGHYGNVDEKQVDVLLEKELSALHKKIIVLDDDPTGVQTVHGISVYTDWSLDSIHKGFEEQQSMFFILTNSRALTVDETTDVHKDIAENITTVSKIISQDFIIISRSDSTLRGHYPLETQVLRKTVETIFDWKYDGEVLFPFFKEGGRFTIDNVHFVQEGDVLTPCGLTEFAGDKSFGYKASHMGEWCEEKTNGEYPSDKLTYISLDDLRSLKFSEIEDQLLTTHCFNKIVVNAIDYVDVKIFCIALLRSMQKGKRFMFRTAAAFTKVLGGVSDKVLLKREELITTGNDFGGIILVGSHVTKTTQQLEELKNCRHQIEFIEFNQHLVISDQGLKTEVKRVVALAEEMIIRGQTVAIYTRRDRFDLPTANKDEQLKVSVQISEAVTSIIGKLSIRPNFIIAKGGITSSDVGIKALKVKKAEVMGQIKPGVPVWMTGKESKFPNMPYIIFPGNVGTVTSLREVVETLMD